MKRSKSAKFWAASPSGGATFRGPFFWVSALTSLDRKTNTLQKPFLFCPRFHFFVPTAFAYVDRRSGAGGKRGSGAGRGGEGERESDAVGGGMGEVRRKGSGVPAQGGREGGGGRGGPTEIVLAPWTALSHNHTRRNTKSVRMRVNM